MSSTTAEGNPCKRGHTLGRFADGRCIACRRVRGAAYRRANPEKCNAWIAAYRRANPEKTRVYGAAWRKANPEKRKACGTAWNKTNPAARYAINPKSRVRKRNALGRGVSKAEWENCFAESLGICAYCNERQRLTLDHIDPLTRGGEHDIENIAAACGPCNSSKNNRTLIIWLAVKADLASRISDHIKGAEK